MRSTLLAAALLYPPCLLNSHWIRRYPEWPASERSTGNDFVFRPPTYLENQRPASLRMAAPVRRGPVPPDPFPPPTVETVKAPEPATEPTSEEDAIVRSLIADAEGEHDKPFLDSKNPIVPDLNAPLPGAFEPKEALPVDPVEPTAEPRRLLLETSIPRARVEEAIPVFQMPVGDSGAYLRLPVAPSARPSANSAPPSSATYRRQK